MVAVVLDFKDALRIDMERRGLSEASLGKALGISQQAIHKWIERGFPPLSRLDALLQVLGPGSEVSKLSREQLYSSTSRTLLSKPHVARERETTYVVRINDSVLRQQFRKTMSGDFVAALPPEIQPFADRTVPVADAALQPDYMSPRILAEVIAVHERVATTNTSAAMLRLVTLAARYPELSPLFIVVQPGDARYLSLAPHVAAAASQFGVEVLYFREPTEAAKAVAEREGVEWDTHIREPDE